MKIPFYNIHLNELNPREEYGDLEWLAESIREHGLLDPIKFVQCDCDKHTESHYRVVDGHRRLRALRLLGRTELNDGEYVVYSLSKQEEIEMMVETNIKRKSYLLPELYNAVQLERKYGVLKNLTKGSDIGYYRLRLVVSVFDRLHPDLRERVVWKKREDSEDDKISFKEARVIASAPLPYQHALADAQLTYKQLVSAVNIIKENIGILPEKVVEQVRSEDEGVSESNKVTAAGHAAVIAMTKGRVTISDLVELGFSRKTAQRTLSILEKAGLLIDGRVNKRLLR